MKAANNDNYDDFSAPIPGESLTKIPGGSPLEHPPQFPDIESASEYMFDTMVEPRQLARVVTLLKHKVTCEAIARAIIFAGFTQGKWTPDVALLLARPALYMVAAVAERSKHNGLLKTYTIMNPDREQQQFMLGFAGLGDEPTEAEIDTTEDQLEDKPLNLDNLDPAAAEGSIPQGAPTGLGGILGRGN